MLNQIEKPAYLGYILIFTKHFNLIFLKYFRSTQLQKKSIQRLLREPGG